MWFQRRANRVAIVEASDLQPVENYLSDLLAVTESLESHLEGIGSVLDQMAEGIKDIHRSVCRHQYVSWHGSRGECQECGESVAPTNALERE